MSKRFEPLKARIVPHGNHDSERDNVRKDSPSARLNIIRLVLPISAILNLQLGTAHIKGAYPQSRPIRRAIYVRPLVERRSTRTYKRGLLRKLNKLTYGIVGAGRQLQIAVEAWMLEEYGLERVYAFSQLFIFRNKEKHIKLIIGKVTDDFLCSGGERDIHIFMTALAEKHTVGEIVVNQNLNFPGCEISQDMTGNIRLTTRTYVERIRPIDISRIQNKQRMELPNSKEMYT